ncbi:MAG: EthD family reductase [Bacteroidota bacterium]|nr:EthD family reductase [Bacteroidota bacterium]
MLSRTRLLLLLLSLFSFCWASGQSAQTTAVPGTIKVTILYPNGDGKNFDMNYYEQKHMPMVAGFIGKNLKFYEIDKGVSGRTPNDKAPFMAIGYFYISDLTAYNAAIGQHRDEIVNDFKNYTNIQPVIQISEVKQLVYPSGK